MWTALLFEGFTRFIYRLENLRINACFKMNVEELFFFSKYEGQPRVFVQLLLLV